MYNIEFYETLNEQCPVEIFLDDMEIVMRAKALREIELLKLNGRDLKEPHSKYLKDGIFELRIRAGNNISRIFYFFFLNDDIIMTNGFIKKTEKTPQSEIKKALKYKDEYQRRNNK